MKLYINSNNISAKYLNLIAIPCLMFVFLRSDIRPELQTEFLFILYNFLKLSELF